MLSAWLRVIRVRFLLASVIAVSVGLALHWSLSGVVAILDAVLTMAGVLALHASVDLLNDFWDFKRGIDTKTRRTKMSGGTGVLPEGLLTPRAVYRAGVISLVAGSAVGAYFVFTNGLVILAILGFAVASIYFYSTKIVDSGAAEIFVAIKGTMIVLGTFFIQSGYIVIEATLAGVLIGILSSMVLFIASFPDYEADKSRGRKTLVIVAGKQRAASIFWAFPATACGIVILGVSAGLFPLLSLVMLLGIPLAVRSGLGLKKHYNKIDELVPFMSSALLFSRVAGALFVLGLIIPVV